MRHRTRRHGGTLWRGSRTERRCGRPRHCRGLRGTSCGGWRSRTGHGGRRCRRSGRRRRRPRPFPLLGGRADARRDQGDTKKKRCKANAARKHDHSSPVIMVAHQPQRASAEIVRPCFNYWHCDFATQGDGEHKPFRRIDGSGMFRRRSTRERSVSHAAGVIIYRTSVNDNLRRK